MGMLYERIMQLCKKNEITGYRLCKDVGLSPGNLTDLKMGRKTGISARNAQKIADYFGVTVGYLLGQEDGKALKIESLQHFAEDEPTDEAYQQIKKFILNANQDELDETLRYIQFIKSQRK